jgi:poly-gamma-glutamate synthase PgsB/CapB
VIEGLDPGDLPRENLWEGIVADLTTRGALGAALASAYAFAVIAWWVLRNRRVLTATRHIPIRILVAGSRGKSSTVRLLHAALHANGRRVFAKATGTAAAQIDPDLTEKPTRRWGQVSIVEMQDAVLHARRSGADAMVLESMAVQPQLIAQLSDEIVHPTIAVVTNAHLDHLEDEGSTREEVMDALANVINGAPLVVTAEQDSAALARLTWQAGLHGALVSQAPHIDARGFDLDGAHPDNVDIVLNITRSLSFPDAVSLAGMRSASHETGDHPVHDVQVEGISIRWIDLGAINDPASAVSALQSIQHVVLPDAPVVAIIVGRSDRPLRSLEFAALLHPGAVDAVLIRGGPEYQVRSILCESGWDRARIRMLRTFDRSPARFVRRLREVLHANGLPPERATVLQLESIHDPVMVRLRRRLGIAS